MHTTHHSTREKGLRRFMRTPAILIVSLLAIAALAFAACDDDDDDGIEIAFVPGWDEGVAVTYLWEHLLEEEGYDVTLTNLDIAATFAGVAGGDVDLYLDGWLPGTHAVYIDEFGADLVQHSEWYSPAGLFLTVPSYVDATSLEDLAAMEDEFNGTITGIEAGAGMMGIAADSVMPAYGLEDWNLQESSTPAMLAELESAINNEEAIVVTLWSPGWWYGRWDLTNLEDPEGAWGDPDGIWVVTRTGFSDDFPDVSRWLGNFSMTDEQISPLLNLISEHGDGNEADAIQEWLEDDANRSLAEGWID